MKLSFSYALALTAALPSLGLVAAGSPAQAATTVVASDCISVAHADGCLFNGNINTNSNLPNPNSYIHAQNAYNLYNNAVVTAQSDITLTPLFNSDPDPDQGELPFPGTVTFDDATETSGGWTLPGYLVNFLAVKASNKFVLYQITPASSGEWDTFDIPFNNNPHGLSHLVFFGSAVPVPEPATWAMMIAGFGLVGGALRRRNVKTTLIYA